MPFGGMMSPGQPGMGGFPMMPQQPTGMMSNPMLMASLMGFASALGGQPSSRGMAAGFQMGQQAQQNEWSRQMQQVQMAKLQRDWQQEEQRRAALQNVLSSPQVREQLGVWGDLAAVPGMEEVILPKVLEAQFTKPKTPSSYQEYTQAQAGGYGGSYTDFLRDFKRAAGAQVSVDMGGGTEPRPTITGDEAKKYNLNPDRVWSWAAKDGKWQDLGPRETIMSGETSRQAAMAESGLKELQAARGQFFNDDDSFNRVAWGGSFVPGTDAWDARHGLLRALANQLRLKTGAAITYEEAEKEAANYMPALTDGDTGAARKLQAIDDFLSGTIENITVGEHSTANLPRRGSGAGPGRFAEMPLNTLTAIDIESLSAEELDAYDRRLTELGY